MLAPSSTGTKCLPHRQLSTARGLLLHDSHAEILAIRAFNRFLLEECRSLLLTRRKACAEVHHSQTSSSKEIFEASPILQRTKKIDEQDISPPFSIRDNISIYLYCSKAPCGDASMDLLMESSDDTTPWEAVARADKICNDIPHPEGLPLDEPEPFTPPLEGRGFFGDLGIVRRKPCTFPFLLYYNDVSMETNHVSWTSPSRRPTHPLQILHRQALPRTVHISPPHPRLPARPPLQRLRNCPRRP